MQILCEISPYLNSRTLVNCRLVCRKWEEMFSKTLRIRGSIIYFESSKQLIVGNPSFLEIIKETSNIPWGRFEFRVEKNLDEYADLMDKIKESITRLKIQSAGSSLISRLRTLVSWLECAANLQTLKMANFKDLETMTNFENEVPTKSLKNLTNFSLTHITERSELRMEFLSWLFKSAKNLRKITLSTDRDEWYTHMCITPNVCGILDNFLNHGNLELLSDLNLNQINDDIIEVLVQLGRKGMKLKKLNFSTRSYLPFSPKGFCNFLSSQQHLESLIVGSACGEIRFPFITQIEVIADEFEFRHRNRSYIKLQ